METASLPKKMCLYCKGLRSRIWYTFILSKIWQIRSIFYFYQHLRLEPMKKSENLRISVLRLFVFFDTICLNPLHPRGPNLSQNIICLHKSGKPIWSQRYFTLQNDKYLSSSHQKDKKNNTCYSSWFNVKLKSVLFNHYFLLSLK